MPAAQASRDAGRVQNRIGVRVLRKARHSLHVRRIFEDGLHVSGALPALDLRLAVIVGAGDIVQLEGKLELRQPNQGGREFVYGVVGRRARTRTTRVGGRKRENPRKAFRWRRRSSMLACPESSALRDRRG